MLPDLATHMAQQQMAQQGDPQQDPTMGQPQMAQPPMPPPPPPPGMPGEPTEDPEAGLTGDLSEDMKTPLNDRLYSGGQFTRFMKKLVLEKMQARAAASAAFQAGMIEQNRNDM